MHPALRVALRHFLMQNSAARRHPLDVAGAHPAAIAKAVAMLDRPGQNIGDRLDPAMRMPREASPIILGAIVAEIVQ